MVDPHPGPDPLIEGVHARRWWPGPRIGAWPFALQMALAATIATLLTACGVGLALLLDSHANRWQAPVVLVLGVLTVLFYCRAIYLSVHPLPADPLLPDEPGDTNDLGGTGSEGVPAR